MQSLWTSIRLWLPSIKILPGFWIAILKGLRIKFASWNRVNESGRINWMAGVRRGIKFWFQIYVSISWDKPQWFRIKMLTRWELATEVIKFYWSTKPKIIWGAARRRIFEYEPTEPDASQTVQNSEYICCIYSESDSRSGKYPQPAVAFSGRSYTRLNTILTPGFAAKSVPTPDTIR